MRKKIKIIDLLCLISNSEEVPMKIKYDGEIYKLADIGNDYYNYENSYWFFRNRFDVSILNDEVEILDEEDKDIPLIPDDELYELEKRDFIPIDKAIDYNFKVLYEKINQVVEELNEYRKGE